MKEIIVKTQAEFDAIPENCDAQIVIDSSDEIVVKKRYVHALILGGDSRAELYGYSYAELRDNSRAWLYGNSDATLHDTSIAWLCGKSSAALCDNSSATMMDNSRAELRDNSRAALYDNSRAALYDNSRAWLHDTSIAVLWDNSGAALWDNSSAELWGNAQVLDRSDAHNIKINGNARIVYDPRNIDEYLSLNGLPADGETCLLYKAVHKTDGGVYKSDHDNRFFYRIGEVAVADGLTTDNSVDCGKGIHLSYPAWAVDYGKDWDDLAILELQVKKSEVIVPEIGCGKVRAKSAKVIREVPLDECGLLGEMVAKRNKKESEK